MRRIQSLILLALALPLVLLARVLKPWVLIRFGRLMSERIGQFAATTEMYLCMRDAGIPPARCIDFFYYYKVICNDYLRKMWERILYAHPFVESLYRVNRLIPGGEDHEVKLASFRDVHGYYEKSKAHLGFTQDEKDRGRAALGEWGLEDDARFVCFAARDSKYLQEIYPHADWRYHNYRDADIKNYLPAAQELVSRGYTAIRMGAITKEPLGACHPKIIDYTSNGRTEFLDIYLSAKCRFYIGDTAGFYALPAIFRRPVAWVNYVPIEYAHTWMSQDLFIPKKLWLRDERRFLTFPEILSSDVGRFLQTGQYAKLGIEPIENTPEEITALAVEMDERLNGTWQGTGEDKKLQARFWTLFEGSRLHGKIVSRIGAAFLRENRALLGQEICV